MRLKRIKFPQSRRVDRIRQWVGKRIGDSPVTDELVERLKLAAPREIGMNVTASQIRDAARVHIRKAQAFADAAAERKAGREERDQCS